MLESNYGLPSVANWESNLIGVGCDGANVNMGTTGGLVTNNVLDCSFLVLTSQTRACTKGCFERYTVCADG